METIVRLEGTGFSNLGEFDSLAILYQKSTVIGLGEATHGTSEFFKLKSRLFAYLSSRYDYKVFAIESSYGGALYINDYVEFGQGNIDSLMLHLSSRFWITQEVKDLIEWMRRYNEQVDPKERVSFMGFDMQDVKSPVEYIRDYISRLKSDSLFELIKIVKQKPWSQYPRFDDYYNPQYLSALSDLSRELDAYFAEHNAMLKNVLGEKSFARLNMCRITFAQAVKNRTSEGKQSYNFRDSSMAYNVGQIYEIEKTKIVLWAHNGHVNLRSSYNWLKSMGQYLRTSFGEKYYSIGFKFNKGTFLAVAGAPSLVHKLVRRVFHKYSRVRIEAFTLPASPVNSFSRKLSATGIPAFMIDLRSTSELLFSSRQIAYDVGAVYMNRRRCLGSFIANQMFDGLIYIDETHPTTLLRY
jgi:erythromycin esterase